MTLSSRRQWKPPSVAGWFIILLSFFSSLWMDGSEVDAVYIDLGHVSLHASSSFDDAMIAAPVTSEDSFSSFIPSLAPSDFPSSTPLGPPSLAPTSTTTKRLNSTTTNVTANATTTTEGGQEEEEEDHFYTIIFLSDMENKYRGHTLERSRFVANYIASSLKQPQQHTGNNNEQPQQFFFDNEYNHIPIQNPQLIINGGDISHFWACKYPSYLFGGGCRKPEIEFQDIWNIFYNAGMPLISAYGNHDWRPRKGTGNPVRGTPRLPRTITADNINRWSSEFVEMSYQKTMDFIGAPTFSYQSIPPTGEIGQSMYRSEFRGLQIVSFNAAYNWQSYDTNGTIYNADSQFEQLTHLLNRTQPTLFFSHFPLSATRIQNQTPTRDQVKALIREFPVGTHHFAGHYHAAVIEPHMDPEELTSNTEKNQYYDYIAPYPHHWNGREPGYLAILVSERNGVVQVKPMTIPGLENGTPCEPVSNQNIRNLFWNPIRKFSPWNWGNSNQDKNNGDDQSSDTNTFMNENNNMNSCNRCKAGRQYWSVSVLGWICGQENTPIGALSSLLTSRSSPNTHQNREFGDSLDEE